jgi:UDP-glucose-4-epimerase GalE
VRWGPLVEADIRDTVTVAQTIERYDIVAAMHFVAFAYVGESISDPAKYYANNVGGLLALLTALRQTGRDTLIFSSTCATYGSPEQSPIDETTPQRPINPYGRSKLMCEMILQDFTVAYGLRYIALRYFNASGADSSARIGEKRAVETRLIPRAMMYLQGHLDQFEVYGNDFPTADGTAVRDYIHVTDLAHAHVLALRYLLRGGTSGAFNLGTGTGYSVSQVLNAIARIAGRAFSPITGHRRPGDPASLVADGRRAQVALGFTPQYSDLDSIIASAWRWHQLAHPRETFRLVVDE